MEARGHRAWSRRHAYPRTCPGNPPAMRRNGSRPPATRRGRPVSDEPRRGESLDRTVLDARAIVAADHGHAPVAERAPRAGLPQRRGPLVEAEERDVGTLALRALDPRVTERLEVRQDGDAGDERERVAVAPFVIAGATVADQRPLAERHRAGGRTRERRAREPRLDDRVPQRRARERRRDEPGIAADEVEEPRGAGALDVVRRRDVTSPDRRQLRDLEAEVPEPPDGVRDGDVGSP